MNEYLILVFEYLVQGIIHLAVLSTIFSTSDSFYVPVITLHIGIWLLNIQ